MLRAVVRLLFFALIVNSIFCDFVVQAQRVARSATPERSEGSLARTEKSKKKSPDGG